MADELDPITGRALDASEANIFEPGIDFNSEMAMEVKIPTTTYATLNTLVNEAVSAGQENLRIVKDCFAKHVSRRWVHIIVTREIGWELFNFTRLRQWHSPGESRAVDRVIAQMEAKFHFREEAQKRFAETNQAVAVELPPETKSSEAAAPVGSK